MERKATEQFSVHEKSHVMPTRGHTDEDSNLHQLLHLRAQDSADLANWMKRKQKWLGHSIESETIEIMANSVLREIAEKVKNYRFFSLIVVKTS